nr:uncharacterized protein LOC123774031 isoform X2 [Procambarus clarkii]
MYATFIDNDCDVTLCATQLVTNIANKIGLDTVNNDTKINSWQLWLLEDRARRLWDAPCMSDHAGCDVIAHLVSSITSSPRDVNYCHVAQNIAERITKEISCDFSMPQLVLLTRVYVPTLRRHYHHYVFALNIIKDQWKQLQIIDGQQKLTMSELRSIPGSQLERQDILLVAEHVNKQLTGESLCVGAIVREVGPHQVWRQVDANQRTPVDAILRSSGYREQDIELFFEEFVRCGYPHSTVSYLDMKQLISELGWKGKEKDIFRAIDRKKEGELGAREFILGLTAMDPMTSHGKEPAELRCRCIFKYYDKNDDGVLEVHEVKEMVRDIAVLHGHEITDEIIKEKSKAALEIFGVGSDSKVPLLNFLLAVSSLRFRGTSLLFRSSMSVVPHLVHKNGLARKKEHQTPFGIPATPRLDCPFSPGLKPKKFKKNSTMDYEDNENNVSSRNTVSREKEKGNQDVEMQCLSSNSEASIPLSGGAFQCSNPDNYVLAQHTVKVRRSGQITDIHLLLDMERAGEVCDTGFDVDEINSCESNGDRRGSKDICCTSSKPLETVSDSRNRLFDRFQSVEAFNLKSLPNEMVAALRFFEHQKKDKPALNWGEVDMIKLGQYIISLCSATKELFENESRLLRLATPCYILGDLHGNYQDLICFEKALWRVGPHLTPANFLFLGDYVDRGDYGIEVVAYLFSQKLQAPNKYFLLRGNHEVRDLQKMFTFQQECLKKFGTLLGKSVWDAVNDVFDCMPLAAIVDKKIFCIHGGIPKLEGCLSELDNIPCPLKNPESQSSSAWQMMWNDPVAAEDMTDDVQGELIANRGFAFNEKRQTACVFNRAAFENFLKRHNFTHVVRAHEVKQAGFEIQQGGRLLTVFSSSHYCGGSNEAACILVHNYRIRVIRIDTS